MCQSVRHTVLGMYIVYIRQVRVLPGGREADWTLIFIVNTVNHPIVSHRTRHAGRCLRPRYVCGPAHPAVRLQYAIPATARCLRCPTGGDGGARWGGVGASRRGSSSITGTATATATAAATATARRPRKAVNHPLPSTA